MVFRVLQIFGTSGSTSVRRRPDEEYHPQFVVPIVKFGGGSLMVWGCIVRDGVGEIAVCEGRMTAAKYIEVLAENLEASVFKICSEGSDTFIFQQDSAPCHTTKISKQRLADNNIRILDWPAQSPDLNPIDHVWAELKRRVKKENTPNVEQLKTAVIKVWSDIDPGFCQKLVDSMIRRVASGIKSKDGPTRY